MFKIISPSKAACFGLLFLGCCSVANATLVATTRSANYPLVGGTPPTVTAWCQAGEVASGGGVQISVGTGDIYTSAPTANGSLQGWSVSLNAVTTQNYQFVAYVYVVCLKEQ